MAGQIPITVKEAAKLEQLWLSSNRLVGQMHHSLSRSRTIKSLRVDRNELTGEIPAFDWNLPLEELSLGFNDFTVVAGFPRTIERLSRLKVLSLVENAFTGTIPDIFVSLSLLRELRLDNNDLSGTVPSEIALLSNLGTCPRGDFR